MAAWDPNITSNSEASIIRQIIQTDTKTEVKRDSIGRVLPVKMC